MPPGFSTNQLYIAADGSQWVYSATQNRWIYTGVPYDVGAGAPATRPTQGTAAGPTTPAIVSTAPSVASSYDQVVDWLKQTSLVDSIGLGVAVPNWLVVGLGGVVVLKVSRSERGRR